MSFSELLNRWTEVRELLADSEVTLTIETRSDYCQELREIADEMDAMTDISQLKDRLSIQLETDQDFTGDGWDTVASVTILLDGEKFSETSQFRLSK